MGTYYELFAEAKVGGKWRGIDFYVRDKDRMRPVPLASGKSDVGSALDWLCEDHHLSPSELSDELRLDHPWYQKQQPEEWMSSLVSAIEGKDLLLCDFSKPEHCGFVDRESILMYERDGVDIEEWLTGAELAKLPPECRNGYSWYEWSQKDSGMEMARSIYGALLERINAFNDITAFNDVTVNGTDGEIGVDDCRVVILRS